MLFGCKVVLIPIRFLTIFLSSTTEFGNMNNLKGSLYHILQPHLVLIIFFLYQTALHIFTYKKKTLKN